MWLDHDSWFDDFGSSELPSDQIEVTAVLVRDEDSGARSVTADNDGVGVGWARPAECLLIGRIAPIDAMASVRSSRVNSHREIGEDAEHVAGAGGCFSQRDDGRGHDRFSSLGVLGGWTANGVTLAALALGERVPVNPSRNGWD